MNYFVSGIFSLLLLVMAGCASKPDMTPKVETANPPDTESFSERALKEKISDSPLLDLLPVCVAGHG